MSGTGTTSIRSYNFFLDTTVIAPGDYASNKYLCVDASGLNFLSQSIQIVNGAGVDIWFSFDGVNDHGRVLPGEPITQDYRRTRTVWFRGAPGSAFRFWAW